MAGLCVSPGFVPSPSEIAALRPGYLRSILYTMADLDVLLAVGAPIMVTLNNQLDMVGGDWSGWDAALDAIGKRANGRVFAIGCGNELDKYWNVNEEDCPPSFAANLVRRAAPILKRYGIKTIATSVVSSRWVEYLQRMSDLCRDKADYFDLHAYGKQADGWRFEGEGTGNLRASLTDAAQIARKPMVMSEIGITIEMAGSEENVAKYLIAVDTTVKSMSPDVVGGYAWFAWKDEVGAPDERGQKAFGLIAEDGRVRPSWHAFAQLDAPSQPLLPVPVEVVQLPPLIEAWAQLWQAVNPALPYDMAIHGFGVPTYWRKHHEEMGSPLAPEIEDTDGTKLQTFTNGVYRWTGNTVEKVTEE